jgi:hypothetical protein
MHFLIPEHQGGMEAQERGRRKRGNKKDCGQELFCFLPAVIRSLSKGMDYLM